MHLFAGCAPSQRALLCCAVLCYAVLCCAVLLCRRSMLWSVRRQMQTEIGRLSWFNGSDSGGLVERLKHV